MKVSFATYDSYSDVGGVSSWLQRLLPLLKVAGFELEVHLLGADGSPGVNSTYFREHGIQVRWTPLIMHLPDAVRSLVRLLEESQPDIYVPNCAVPAYYAGGYASRAGIATVGVLHSDDPVYWGIDRKSVV